MILSVTLSKPNSDVENILGKPYQKIKIKYENSASGAAYFMEMFTQKQVFHQHISEQELEDFLSQHAGTTFKNCIQRTEDKEITILANKKGKISRLEKKIKTNNDSEKGGQTPLTFFPQKKKNYLIPEGTPVPFLILLGIMTADGKIVKAKYDKFRQINRFLEFINDILPELLTNKEKGTDPSSTLHIADFGCGKSYLTFAVHYFLTEIKKIPCQIEGLDLKEDVINYCNQIAVKLNLQNLIFHTGNIADYSGKENPDLVITLHACDTATDYALEYAVQRNAKAILSVPCCQHQINQQLNNNKNIPEEFKPLTKWGIIQEKFSSLVTDTLRGNWLEQQGYKVQMLEFIDLEHTPKNILIRAVKTSNSREEIKLPELGEKLGIKPELF